MVEAIPGELNQVWTNLIDNAVDAMDGSGTLWITVRGPMATASSWRSPTTGRGVPTTWRPTPSSRSSRPRTSGKGTGLGLDISRRIVVERHGGEISLESRDGGGAVVVVRLPLRAAAD